MTTTSLPQQSPQPTFQPSPTYPFYSGPESERSHKAIAPRQEVVAARASGQLDNSVVPIHIDRTERDEREAAMDSYVFEGGFKLPPLHANVVKMLREPRAYAFGLCYEEFARKAYCRSVEYSDHDLREITEWVQRRKCLAPAHVVHDAILHAAYGNRFHVVKDYLDSLTWDGRDRLDTLLIDHGGAEDSVLHRAQMRRWLIQAVARIYQPGCQADATLVIEGEQGLRKSSFLQVLFSDAWMTDFLPDLDNKDAMMQLAGCWLVELAELATIAKQESASIKRFLTSRVDRYRVPYGKVTQDYPRSCVFAGTVNPGAGGYLKDETGGRRFWLVEVTRVIDTDAVEEQRDQIWAEAVARFKAGELWFLLEEHLALAAREQQAERYVGDPWLEAIQTYVEPYHWVTLTELLDSALGKSKMGDWSRADQKRVAECMAVLGWKNYQARDGEKRVSRYRRVGTPLARQKLINPRILDEKATEEFVKLLDSSPAENHQVQS